MSAAAFMNPIAPIRNTTYYDRVLRPTSGPMVPLATAAPPASRTASLTPLPAGGGDYQPAQGISAENTAKTRANQYAASAFDKWYGGLKPEEQAKFAPTGPVHSSMSITMGDGHTIDPAATGGRTGIVSSSQSSTNDPDNIAGITRENARKHFTTQILPTDAGYQSAQTAANTATDARIQMTPLPAYQANQDAMARANAESGAQVGAVNAGADATRAAADSTRATANRTTTLTPIVARSGQLANDAAADTLDNTRRLRPITDQEAKAKADKAAADAQQAGAMVQPNVAFRTAQAGVEQRAADTNFVPRADHEKAVKDRDNQIAAMQKQLQAALAKLQEKAKTAPSLADPSAGNAVEQLPLPANTNTQAGVQQPQTPSPAPAASPAASAAPPLPPGAIPNPDGTITLNGVVYRRKV
jgi:hypothetical protein